MIFYTVVTRSNVASCLNFVANASINNDDSRVYDNAV